MPPEETVSVDTGKAEATCRLLNALIATNLNAQQAIENCRHMKARFSALMAFLEVCFEIQETEGDVKFTDVSDVLYNFALEGHRMQPVNSALDRLKEQLNKKHALAQKER